MQKNLWNEQPSYEHVRMRIDTNSGLYVPTAFYTLFTTFWLPKAFILLLQDKAGLSMRAAKSSAYVINIGPISAWNIKTRVIYDLPSQISRLIEFHASSFRLYLVYPAERTVCRGGAVASCAQKFVGSANRCSTDLNRNRCTRNL